MSDELERPSFTTWFLAFVALEAGIVFWGFGGQPVNRPPLWQVIVAMLALAALYVCVYQWRLWKYRAERRKAAASAAAQLARTNEEARQQEERHEAERAANRAECNNCGVVIRRDWLMLVANGFWMCRICLKQATDYPPGTEKIGVRRAAYLAEEIECGKCHQPRPRSVFWKTPKVEQQLVPATCKINPVRLPMMCDSCWATLMTEKLPHTFPWAKRAFPDRQQDVTVSDEN